MAFNPGARVTPQTATANWVSGSTAKAAKWVTNTLAPKRLFTDAAIANASEWLAKLNQVGTAGYVAGMTRAAGNLNQIATNIQTNGAALYSAGITNKQYKTAAAFNGLIPAIQQIAANLPPRGNLQQNLARMQQQATQAAALRGQFRG
jgi:hypothetical protein